MIPARARARALALPALFACLALSVSGCVTLSTWERATLMSAAMEDPASPMEAVIEEHVHAVREAGQGATAAAGSSCGCN